MELAYNILLLLTFLPNAENYPVVMDLNDPSLVFLNLDEEFEEERLYFEGNKEINLNFDINFQDIIKKILGYVDQIKWNIDPTRNMSYSNFVESGRKLSEMDFEQFSLENIFNFIESYFPIYPENLHISKNFEITYSMFQFLIKEDEEENSIPLVFYKSLFLAVSKYIEYSNKDEIDHTLAFPNLRYHIQSLISITKFEGEYYISRLYKKFKEIIQIYGLKYNKKNLKLVKGYKDTMTNFVENFQSDLNLNKFPLITIKFMLENEKEILQIFIDMVNFQSILSDLKVNYGMSYILAHLNNNLISNRKEFENIHVHDEL